MIPSSADLEREMKRYASSERALIALQKEMDEKLEHLRASYRNKMASYMQLQAMACSSLTDAAYRYYDLWFSKEKKMELSHGCFGFYKEAPRLIKQRGKTWEQIIQTCEQQAPTFLSPKKELSHEKILAQRHIPAVQSLISLVGLQVVEDEFFFIRSKEKTSAPKQKIRKKEALQPI